MTNSTLEAENAEIRDSRDFYRRRCDLLQHWQSKMRDPERTIVCDILANCATLPDKARYAVPEAAQSQAAAMAGLLEEARVEVASVVESYQIRADMQLLARIDAALATWKGNTK